MIYVWAAFGIILGAVMGSFACCQARRLRRREKKLVPLGKWSTCEKCKHRLAPWENIPIISWLALRGKCWHCGAKIGTSEILSEVSMTIIFGMLSVMMYYDFSATSGSGWVVPMIQWILLLAAVVAMWVVVVYDAKWGEMPVRPLIIAVVLAVIYALINIFEVTLTSSGINFGFNYALMLNVAVSLAVLPGLYFALYFLSRENLVGGGDWLLALAIALFLQNWWLSFFELFISNALASIVAIFFIIKGRKSKRNMGKAMSMKIPFGPYLVVAFIAVMALEPLLMKMMSF